MTALCSFVPREQSQPTARYDREDRAQLHPCGVARRGLYDGGQGRVDPADFALRLLHKDVGLAVGLGREVGVPMRLANMAYDELTEAMNRSWGARNSTVGQLLQVERAGIEPLAADPQRIAAVLGADKQK